jgi:hypothetical protein
MRDFAIHLLLNRKAITVARPVSVKPEIRVPSFLQEQALDVRATAGAPRHRLYVASTYLIDY